MKPIWKTLIVEDNTIDALLMTDVLVRSDGVKYEITVVGSKKGLMVDGN